MRTSLNTLKFAMSMFVGSALLFSQASADQLDKIKQRDKIIIGIKNDYKPFGSLRPDGSLEGFEIDLARFVGEQIIGSPEKVELVPVVASNRIELLNQGRIDVIVATLGRTAERAKVLDYSKDYYMLGEGAVVAPEGSRLKDWEALKGAKLCGILGNSFNRVLSDKYGAEMVLFQGTSEMFKAFEDNRCEGIGFDEPLLQQRVTEKSNDSRYRMALPAESFIPLAAGVRKNEPALLEAVNKAVVKAEAAGLLTGSAAKYNMAKSQFLEEQQVKSKAQAQ